MTNRPSWAAGRGRERWRSIACSCPAPDLLAVEDFHGRRGHGAPVDRDVVDAADPLPDDEAVPIAPADDELAVGLPRHDAARGPLQLAVDVELDGVVRVVVDADQMDPLVLD